LITPPYGLALLMASKFVGVRFGKAMFRIAADLRRLFRRYRVLYFFPRYRAVAAQAAAARIGWLLQEPERCGYICP